MRYFLWIECHDKINEESSWWSPQGANLVVASTSKQAFPALPNLFDHTQGSFCGFDCNPSYTLDDPELGLAQTCFFLGWWCSLSWFGAGWYDMIDPHFWLVTLKELACRFEKSNQLFLLKVLFSWMVDIHNLTLLSISYFTFRH